MFRRLNIQRRLALVLWGSVLLAFIVAGAGLALFQGYTLERRVLQIMKPYAELVAVGTDAAVAFEDPRRAQEILDTLRVNPEILEADLFLEDGRLLASFSKKPPAQPRLRPTSADGVFLAKETAELVQRLPHGARLRLSMGLGQLHEQTNQMASIFGAGMLVLLLATFGQLLMLKRTLVQPIASLSDTAELVRAKGDYKYRVPVVGTDEVARLGQSFNAMMEAIQERENELRRLMDLQRAIVENAAWGIISTTVAGTVTTFNPAAERLLGYTRDEVMGKLSPLSWHVAEELAGRAKELSAALAEPIEPGMDVFRARPRHGEPEEHEWTFVRKDGTRVPVMLAVTALRENGQITGLLGLTSDLTKRKQDEAARRRAEQARAASETRYRRLFESSKDGLLILDGVTEQILDANPALLELLGYTRAEVVGYTVTELGITGQDAACTAAFHELASRDEGHHPDLRLRGREGKEVDADVVGTAYTVDGQRVVQWSIRDIRERRRLEGQLRLSQKMEAVGQLAGGVAHDFNNLLVVINTYSELAVGALPLSDPMRADLEQVAAAGARAAALTRQLLAFSRRQFLQPQVLSLSAVVGGLEKLLRRLINEDVVLDIRRAEELWSVRADPAQMEQVIMNLVLNARDAMPQGGTLRLETSDVTVDESSAARHPELKPGDYVVLTVADTGCGMDEKTQARIFEPFFTTKAPGKGTGLGLATVYGIVKQTGGHICVESEVNRGSTFRIYLPREQAAAASAVVVRPPAPSGGSETILVVEDDDAVRRLIQRVLQPAGYTVIVAPSGEAAIELCQKREGPLQLLLTDVVMPNMSGSALAARLATIRPGVRVVFMSGYMDETVGASVMGLDFIHKPFTASGLLTRIREALDRR